MPETLPPSSDAAAHAPLTAFVDVCHVQCADASVEILFGQRVATGPGALGVNLQQRITLGRTGASQLQDLMTALLQGADAPRQPR